MAISIRDRINDALVKKGLISSEDLQGAIKFQKEKGGKLSDILVNKGLIKKDTLVTILSQELGMPIINITRYKITPDVLKLIPKKMALRYKILPISKMGNILTIAMIDPLNIFAIDDIKTLTGFNIGPVITTEKDMNDAIEQYYGEDTHQAVEKIIEDIEESKRIEMVEDSGDDFDSSKLMQLTEEGPVVKVTNMILNEGI